MEVQSVDLSKGLSFEELDQLIAHRDYVVFLNTRNVLYREMNMRVNPPTRSEALQLMSENPNLIRRPLIKWRGRIFVGFDAAYWDNLSGYGN